MNMYVRSWDKVDTEDFIITDGAVYLLKREEYPENPRVMFGHSMTLIADLGSYGNFSDSEEPQQTFYDDLGSPEDVDPGNLQALANYALSKGWYVAKVYAYVHSGVRFSLMPFSCKWDSGCCGIIYADPSKVSGDLDTIAKTEIAELDSWASGDVWSIFEGVISRDRTAHGAIYLDRIIHMVGDIYGYDYALELLQEEALRVRKS